MQCQSGTADTDRAARGEASFPNSCRRRSARYLVEESAHLRDSAVVIDDQDVESDDQRLCVARTQTPLETDLLVMAVGFTDGVKTNPGNWSWTCAMAAPIVAVG